MINERRDFYRIQDDVLLRYQSIDRSAALANQIPAQFSKDSSYTLLHQIQTIEQESSKHLHAIAADNRELESYLKSITKKIDTIASYIVESIAPVAGQHSKTITLSEGGLSFCSNQEFASDDYLAIHISFLPSRQTVILFAKIINCTETNNGEYSIAVSFVHLSENDRQLIAKHIMQLQMTRKRELRDAPKSAIE